jgi:segregation and condensation protein B
MNKLSQQIEALLFALGRGVSRKELMEKLGAKAEELELALHELEGSTGRTIELRVSGEASRLVEQVRKDELSRDLGRAGQEALSAILYRGPLTRSEIDFIRGVNSSQILRTLLVRGLVRRVPNPKDERSFLYEPTTELLAQLGVSAVKELPDYPSVTARLKELEEAYRAKEQAEPQES